LRDEGTAFVVISTPSESPLQEAEFFLAELERRKLRTGAFVLNRTLPDLFLDDRSRRAAAGLLDGGTDASDSSGALVESRVFKSRVSGGSPSGEEHMVKAIAETFLRFAGMADAQRRQLAKLAKVPPTVVRIPMFETPLADVDGLGAMVRAIW
jgi:anion-transporting  ArsA/GET3 family ATPase